MEPWRHLRRHVGVLEGGVLLLLVYEGCVGRKVALGQVVSLPLPSLDDRLAIGLSQASEEFFYVLLLYFLAV
jgi:hypothetical protein